MRTMMSFALTGLLDSAERKGFKLSPEVYDYVEKCARATFDLEKDPDAAIEFASAVKATAVRLYRQRRFRDADSHYRLAALVNSDDPTLTSNRAICMFNQARFEECRRLCLACLSDFPNLFSGNPLLYFKLVARKGRADIELGNLLSAEADLEDLKEMSKGYQYIAGPTGSLHKEMMRQLSPFEKRLKAKLEFLQQHGSDGTKAKDDHEESEPDSRYPVIRMENICEHLYNTSSPPCTCIRKGRKPGGDECNCTVTRVDSGYPSSGSEATVGSAGASNKSADEREACDGDDRAPSFRNSFVEDQDIPALVSDESEEYTSSNDEDSAEEDGNDDGVEKVHSRKSTKKSSKKLESETPSVSRTAKVGGSSKVTGAGKKPQSASKASGCRKLDWTNAFKSEFEKEASSLKNHRFAKNAYSLQSSDHAAPSSLKKGDADIGFRRGFLNSRSSLPLKKEEYSPPAISDKPESVRLRENCAMTCYDSDDEAPYSSGLICEREEQDKALMRYEKNLPPASEIQTHEILVNVIRDVLGNGFLASRTIDFAHIFGNHVLSGSSGKRRKKSCVANCAPCFAQKMWKLRFKCSDNEEADSALKYVEENIPKKPHTQLWKRTGYYGSGYEMAFDVSALLHGVAYICHLQCELHWRGDKIPAVKDIEFSLIDSLTRNLDMSGGIRAIFSVYRTARDTVQLLPLLSPESQGSKTSPSFHFSNTSSKAALSVLPSSAASVSVGSSQFNVLNSSKSESLARNVHKWAGIGQLEREELWIYNILLRDIGQLLSKQLRTPIPKSVFYFEPKASFFESFKEACGDTTKDEKYWSCRILTIVERDRCRQIEGYARKAQKKGDFEQSAMLYSNALSFRPQQARILYRRAQIKAAQRKWKECLNDIRKGIAAIDKFSVLNGSPCPTPRDCLLSDFHTLSGDVLRERSTEHGDNSIASLGAAIESYKKARFLVSDPDNGLYDEELEQKLLITSQEHGNLLLKEEQSEAKRKKKSNGPSASGKSQRKSPKPSRKAPIPEKNPDMESSSEEDEEAGTLAGNPYALLQSAPIVPNEGANVQPPPKYQKPSKSRVSSRGKPDRSKRSDVAKNTKRQSEIDVGSVPEGSADLEVSRCDLCNVSFGGKVGYDSHMRGRRHRTAVANGRGRDRSGDGASSSQNTQTGSSSTSPNFRIGSPNQSSSSITSSGPTQEEAIAEAERVMAVLGGEARPCDVVARMNFTKWNIHDVYTHLEISFGGLLRLCQMRSDLFGLREGSESRPVLMLKNRVRNQSSQRRTGNRAHLRPAVPHHVRVPRRSVPSQSSRFNIDDSDFPALHSQRMNNTSQAISIPIRHAQGGSSSSQRADVGDSEERETCGICMDRLTNVRCMPCKHEWCEDCIMSNIERGRVHCPVCVGQVTHLELLVGDLD